MIRIKVALLDQDQTYLTRLVNAFNTYYQDKLEVYSFSDKEFALEFITQNRIDVLLADELISINPTEIPSRIAFAYMTMMNSVESVNGQKAICKFQKVDLIYKEILSVFSETSPYSMSTSDGTSSKRPLTYFVSVAGGTGASTVAAAYAINKAAKGGKPFYLNLELLGGAGTFFKADGNMNLSDIVYALKSKKNNISLKIESAVKVSFNGVSFIDSANLALDVNELNSEDVLTLIDEISSMPNFDEVIIDIGFGMDELCMEIIRRSNKVVAISDGSDIANYKTFRYIEALRILEEQSDENLTSRFRIFYNRFSSNFGKRLTDININTIGGVPRIEGTSSQIVDRLATNPQIEKI